MKTCNQETVDSLADHEGRIADLEEGGSSANNFIVETDVSIVSNNLTLLNTQNTCYRFEGGTNTTLNTITGGTDGQIVTLGLGGNEGDSVVCKNSTGIGSIMWLKDSTDFTLSDPVDCIMLMYNGFVSAWVEISRSTNFVGGE